MLFLLWIYEKKFGATPCMIQVRGRRTVNPAVTERTPLITERPLSRECDALPPVSSDRSSYSRPDSHQDSGQDYGSVSIEQSSLRGSLIRSEPA